MGSAQWPQPPQQHDAWARRFRSRALRVFFFLRTRLEVTCFLSSSEQGARLSRKALRDTAMEVIMSMKVPESLAASLVLARSGVVRDDEAGAALAEGRRPRRGRSSWRFRRRRRRVDLNSMPRQSKHRGGTERQDGARSALPSGTEGRITGKRGRGATCVHTQEPQYR